MLKITALLTTAIDLNLMDYHVRGRNAGTLCRYTPSWPTLPNWRLLCWR